ncbi:CoA transferase subunit A [Oceanobacillus longus]|uniref:CoA transferase subunit A n=1 Tax=Oceanobacillus longus TaxID=930120 RepID=A0ABV8H4J7_9BACI
MVKQIESGNVLDLINNADTLLVGGFGLSGTPLTILDEIAMSDKKDLTVVSNNLGEPGRGLGKLLLSGRLKKAVGSFFTTNPDSIKEWSKGKLEIELIPQGTLAEAIRAGGAGIGGFYTKTGVGTEIAEGKEEKVIDDERYILEKAIKGDVSIIKAMKADTLGNLVYDHTAMNFNPLMATAGKVVIAEVDEIVECGEIAPFDVATPHLYVDYLLISKYKKVGGVYVEPV